MLLIELSLSFILQQRQRDKFTRLQLVPSELRNNMTAEKVMGLKVIIDCYRSQRMAHIPRAAQMSAGYIKCHQEFFQAA